MLLVLFLGMLAPRTLQADPHAALKLIGTAALGGRPVIERDSPEAVSIVDYRNFIHPIQEAQRIGDSALLRHRQVKALDNLQSRYETRGRISFDVLCMGGLPEPKQFKSTIVLDGKKRLTFMRGLTVFTPTRFDSLKPDDDEGTDHTVIIGFGGNSKYSRKSNKVTLDGSLVASDSAGKEKLNAGDTEVKTERSIAIFPLDEAGEDIGFHISETRPTGTIEAYCK